MQQSGKTTMTSSHGCCCTKLVQQLLAAGADVDAEQEGRTPLHLAIQAGQDKVLQVLLAAGADVNAKMPDGCTVLHLATRLNMQGVVQQLVTAGADVEASYGQSNFTPLLAASFQGYTDVVRVLLAAGATTEAAGPGYISPLQAAVCKGSLEMMRLLLHSGADPRRERFGCTCLELAVLYGKAAVVQLLLDEWGQPAVTADVLVRAARSTSVSVGENGQEACAILAMELRKRYPAALQQLFGGMNAGDSGFASSAVAAVIRARELNVSKKGEQRPALCKRQQQVAKEQQTLQEVLVCMAVMAKNIAQQAPARSS
jgi:ankyrin repeat protein